MNTFIAIDAVRLAAAIRHGHDAGRTRTGIGVHGWWLSADEGPPLDVRLPLNAGEACRVAVVDIPPSCPAATFPDAWLEAMALTARHVPEDLPPAAAGCFDAATITMRPGGHTVIHNVGDVHVFRTIEGYAGQVTAAEPKPAGRTPHRYQATLLPGDRLILCTTSGNHAITAAVHEVAGLPGPAAASQLAEALTDRYGVAAGVAVVLDITGPGQGQDQDTDGEPPLTTIAAFGDHHDH